MLKGMDAPGHVHSPRAGNGHVPAARGPSPEGQRAELSPARRAQSSPRLGARRPPRCALRADEHVSGAVACVLFCFLNMSKQTVSLPLLSDVVELFSPKLPKYKVST